MVLKIVLLKREWKNDQLFEVTRNYFTLDEKTGDLFYFGEEVDFCFDGKIVNQKGA